MSRILIKPWVVCITASIFILLQFILQISPSVMLPQLMHTFSIDVLGVGILSSSYFYTYLLLQVPSGILADRIGARKILIWSIMFCSLTCLIFPFVDDMRAAFGLRMLMGLFSAPAVACTMYLCAKWFPVHLFALAVGVIESVGIFGGAVGQYVLSRIVESPFGWQGTFYFCAIWGFLLTIAVAVLVYDCKYESCPLISSKREMWNSFRNLVSNYQVWLIGLFSGLMFMVLSSFAGLWCIPYLKTLYNIEGTEGSKICSLIFVGAAIGAPVVGWMVKLFKTHKYIMLFWSLMVTLMFALVIYVPPKDKVIMSAFLIALGFFSSIYVLPFAAVKGIVPKLYEGAAMGFTNMLCIVVGAPLLQPLVGYILKHYLGETVNGTMIFRVHDYQQAFMVFLIGSIIATLINFFIKETYKNHNIKI